jgi:hypothetical protein
MDQLQASIQREASTGKTSMEFKVSGFSMPGNSELQNIIVRSANTSSFYYSVNERFGIIRIYNLKY